MCAHMGLNFIMKFQFVQKIISFLLMDKPTCHWIIETVSIELLNVWYVPIKVENFLHIPCPLVTITPRSCCCCYHGCTDNKAAAVKGQTTWPRSCSWSIIGRVGVAGIGLSGHTNEIRDSSQWWNYKESSITVIILCGDIPLLPLEMTLT